MTSQIDVSVNAPEAGTIKEFLVKEEDTVTVGQDLVKLELGGAPETKKEEAAEKPKGPAKVEKPQPSEPEKPKAPAAEKGATPRPEQTKAPSPKAEPQPVSAAPAAPGSREERRVGFRRSFFNSDAYLSSFIFSFLFLGENEPDAVANCGTSEAISKYGCLTHYFQRG